jgi:hypothetical protein
VLGRGRAISQRFCILALLVLGCAEDAGRPTEEAPGQGLPVRAGLAGRLTPAQHRNIASDVLDVELGALELAAAGGGIPQEQPSTGLFRNGADGQAAADDYPLAFARLAALVAGQVDIAALLASVPGCAESASACERAFVAELGKRLFRRPLSSRETDAFAALHAAVVSEGLSFDEACRSVLEAMLQAPAFVFRLERELGGVAGERRYLDGYELASRLAFFLWDSAPDRELLELAGAGVFDGSPAGLPALRQQVARLLSDPRARRMTAELVRDFAGTERAAFVGVTPELRTSLLDSMVATVDGHLWEQRGTIRELFTTRKLSLDPSAAALLGLVPLGDGQHVYDVSLLPERVGWLSHPGFIAGMGDAQVGKIVHRGITLMTKLMCRQPIQLPDGLEATTADFNTMYAELTERQRSEERQKRADCWACHAQFEPLAYGFDRFDAAGRYLGAVDEQGRARPIDGWTTDDLSIDEAARPRYADMAELMALMADSETIQACMAEHFLAFATGRASSEIEEAFAVPVHEALERAGGTLPAMVEAVVTSELFRALEVAP